MSSLYNRVDRDVHPYGILVNKQSAKLGLKEMGITYIEGVVTSPAGKQATVRFPVDIIGKYL